MPIVDNSLVVRTSRARRAAREDKIVESLRNNYVVECIMRKVRQKAMKSDRWSVEVPLTWPATLMIRSGEMGRFVEDYVERELVARGFDIPVSIIVFADDWRPTSLIWRTCISVTPPPSR